MKLIRTLGIALIVCVLAIAFNSQIYSQISQIPSQIQLVTPAGATNLSDRAVLVDFADQVVVPTYKQLAAQTQVLKTAIDLLAQSPDPQNLQSAQTAWLKARVPLKQGEAFALGLARSRGLDGTLDTVPIDQTDLNQILKSAVPLTPEYVSSQRDSLKGFRVLEFLLFGESKALSRRQLEYLQATATVLDHDAHQLLAVWTENINGRPAFRDIFTTAGQPENMVYPSVAIARQEIIEGMLETAEVLEDSIADPFKEQDPSQIEAQYAIGSSIMDFHNTLVCVQNAYLGSFNNPVSGKFGLSAFVAKIQPQLNTKVVSAFQTAIAAIDRIPSPFHQAITNPQTRKPIKQAIAAISKLRDTLEEDVKPLVL